MFGVGRHPLIAGICPTDAPARMVFAATGCFLMAFAVLAAGPLIGCLCMFAVRETSSAVTRNPWATTAMMTRRTA
jgi:hypothetical protein